MSARQPGPRGPLSAPGDSALTPQMMLLGSMCCESKRVGRPSDRPQGTADVRLSDPGDSERLEETARILSVPARAADPFGDTPQPLGVEHQCGWGGTARGS